MYSVDQKRFTFQHFQLQHWIAFVRWHRYIPIAHHSLVFKQSAWLHMIIFLTKEPYCLQVAPFCWDTGYESVDVSTCFDMFGSCYELLRTWWTPSCRWHFRRCAASPPGSTWNFELRKASPFWSGASGLAKAVNMNWKDIPWHTVPGSW